MSTTAGSGVEVAAIETPAWATAATSPTTGRSPWWSTRSGTSTGCSTWPRRRGVRITHVLETHVHNDYVTGGLELARPTGAAYHVNAGRRRWPSTRSPVSDGDVVEVGPDAGAGAAHPGAHPPPVSYVLDAGRSRAGGVHRRVAAVRLDRPHRPARPRAHRTS